MRTIFLMQPRQSGKTTKAIYEFSKDPDNTVFVTYNELCKKDVVDRFGNTINRNNVITSTAIINKLCSRRPKNIILDEYMLFKNRDEIYETIKVIQPDNVYIFSTSDKVYSKTLFEFVKNNKRTLSYNQLLIIYNGILTDYIEKEIYDLYYNFLTDSDTILIDGRQGGVIDNRSNLISIIGKERYNVEINNVYLTEGNPSNIHSEIEKIHHQFGTSEKANYEIQKLFNDYVEVEVKRRTERSNAACVHDFIEKFGEYYCQYCGEEII
jgi:hypothetical protein